MARIESYDPPWPLPKLFRMKKGNKINAGIFVGETINTPSMLATEDYIAALEWAKSIGGRRALVERANANSQIVKDWIEATPWLRNMASDPAQQTNTGVCMMFQGGSGYEQLLAEDQAAVPKEDRQLLEDRNVGYDFNGYRDAPPSLRNLVRLHGRAGGREAACCRGSEMGLDEKGSRTAASSLSLVRPPAKAGALCLHVLS